MTINFVGNYQNGYVGEISDESHIARELESVGNKVVRVPRDVWKAHVDGYEKQPDWVLPDENADINIVAKWPHFDHWKYVDWLRKMTNAPVFYWVWDYMNEFDPENWNVKMAIASDLYLTGEGGLIGKYREAGIPAYYFQMDVCDGNIKRFKDEEKKYDVIFTGSMIQKGHRRDWLVEINNQIPVKVFSWNYEEWAKLGLDASPAVYGEEYNKLVAQSKVVLGFNVEPNCYGYWSNRVGKVLRAWGYLLQEYAPGMESLVGYNADFFSSPGEAIAKAKNPKVYVNGHIPDTHRFTSAYKAEQLTQLIERFLKKGDEWII